MWILLIILIFHVHVANGEVSLRSEDDKIYGETGAIAETLLKKRRPTTDYWTGMYLNIPMQVTVYFSLTPMQ